MQSRGARPYHDRLALVLNDMTRAADLVAASQTQEHELIRGIDRLFRDRSGIQGRSLPLGRHGSS